MEQIMPNIMVNDVNATIEYYTNIIGFKKEIAVDENKGDGASGTPLIWAMLKKDNLAIMFQRKDVFIDELPELRGKEIGGTFTLYIPVKNIENFLDSIKDKVKVIKNIHTTWYGCKEFVIKDLNGYILYFAEYCSSDKKE